ncbi:hypothetical protein [Ruegeria sp. HKCCD6109]|uniref:hypothetical protein n=1 Tax=Ruegeria sp. HKCCD6109 TaxID=2683017 RepID=UPI0014916814|nr:hypothetical protein [Ruegeria sp. HKCCD6109]NOD65772.1 hypothetical protein [Ruegeria sp. HKCCD6109]
MTTDSAPERISASAQWIGTSYYTAFLDVRGSENEFSNAQYIRTDIAEAEKEAAVLAERERLIREARELKPRDHYEVREAGSDYCSGVNDVVRALETAIRKGDDND